MSCGFKKSLLSITVAGLLIAPVAHATNGYFAHGYSMKEKALAGAGAACSQDTLASANNPAGMVDVGDRLDVGAAIFAPGRQYTVTGSGGAGFILAEGTYESSHDYFLIPAFGWEDMTVVKVGYLWLQNDMTWRVGVSNGSQPIPDSEVLFNILAPGVIETHLSFGFTKPLDANSELDFAFMYAPSNEVSGINPDDPAQTIELEMEQIELGLSYAKKF